MSESELPVPPAAVAEHTAGNVPIPGLLIATPSFAAQDWGAVTPGGWAGLLYSGLLAIGLGYAIWVKGVQRLGGSRTAVYSNLTPIIATLTGVIFLGEHITALQIVGAACVLGGIVLTRVRG